MSYHVTYEITPHPAGIELDDIPKGHGAADALYVLSIIHPEGGGFSVAHVGLDGRTGEDVPALDVFKAWCILAHSLSEDERLTPNKRVLCGAVHDAVVAAIRSARGITR